MIEAKEVLRLIRENCLDGKEFLLFPDDEKRLLSVYKLGQINLLKHLINNEVDDIMSYNGVTEKTLTEILKKLL